MRYVNGFDGGTDGATITATDTANSGDGFDALSGSYVYAADHTAHGTLAAKVANPGTTAALFRRSIGGATMSGRFYLRVTDWPVGDFWLARITAAGEAKSLVIMVKGDATLSVDSSDASQVWRSTRTLTGDVWYRLEYWLDLTAGHARVALYEGDSMTPTTESGLLTGLNLGGTDLLNHRLGKVGSIAWPGTMWVDSEETRTGADATGLIGPPAAPATRSPLKRWDGTQYVDLTAHIWDGTTYVPVTTS